MHPKYLWCKLRNYNQQLKKKLFISDCKFFFLSINYEIATVLKIKKVNAFFWFKRCWNKNRKVKIF